MRRIVRQQPLVFVFALAMLASRALMPDGYMPGTRGSGLLFELCPSGMPVEIMRALGKGHHHHHHGQSDRGSAASADSCPIGHMLSSAVAVDSDVALEIQPATLAPESERFYSSSPVLLTAYRSRAPPA